MLDTIFHTFTECKENTCKINKKDVKRIYKPDLGIKDSKLKKEIFGHTTQPALCDCIILKEDNTTVILEIKCGTVTNHILKEIITQIENVYKILEYKKITINKCMFICKKLDSAMVKKKLLTTKIKKLPLAHKVFTKDAIAI